MANIFKILLIGLVGIFILTGCRTGATVYNVPTSDMSVKKGTTCTIKFLKLYEQLVLN